MMQSNFLTGRSVVVTTLAVLLLLMAGCSTLDQGVHRPNPVTIAMVREMSKAGVPAETIIQKMRDSGTVYRLTAAQLARLHDEGVPNKVINYMQQTYLSAVRHNQALADQNYWALESDGYWYGGLPFGWPGEWGGFNEEEFEGHKRDHERTEEDKSTVHPEHSFEDHSGGAKYHDPDKLSSAK